MKELKFYQNKAKELGVTNPSDDLDEVIEQIIEYTEEDPEEYLEQLEEEFEQQQ